MYVVSPTRYRSLIGRTDCCHFKMPPTCPTKGCDFVISRYIIYPRQLTLLLLEQQDVSAVLEWYGGYAGTVGVEEWWRGCQEVAAGAIFMSRVVGEEVLQQSRRRFP